MVLDLYVHVCVLCDCMYISAYLKILPLGGVPCSFSAYITPQKTGVEQELNPGSELDCVILCYHFCSELGFNCRNRVSEE